jgi:hypothetical protein
MPIIGGIAVVVFPALAWAVGELAWFKKCELQWSVITISKNSSRALKVADF